MRVRSYKIVPSVETLIQAETEGMNSTTQRKGGSTKAA